MLVKIEDIKVKKRVRKDLGDLESLKNSLKTYGLLNPITLNSRYQLIAGERRLEAAKALGWTTINCNILPDMDEARQLEMEIEENNQRKEFTDDELYDGYNRLKKLQNPNIFVKIGKAIAKFFKMIAEAFKNLFKKQK